MPAGDDSRYAYIWGHLEAARVPLVIPDGSTESNAMKWAVGNQIVGVTLPIGWAANNHLYFQVAFTVGEPTAAEQWHSLREKADSSTVHRITAGASAISGNPHAIPDEPLIHAGARWVRFVSALAVSGDQEVGAVIRTVS